MYTNLARKSRAVLLEAWASTRAVVWAVTAMALADVH